jgi:hypothetical protein
MIATVLAAATFLVASLAVPALGGPQAVSTANALKLAKKALQKANRADKRAKQALREADKVSAQGGTQGPPGPAGAAGPAGTQGKDAFGSVTYVDGLGGTTGAQGYVFDAAYCPPGQAPTGGSFSPLHSELGGNDPVLGDYGDVAFDSDTPEDGYIDAWAAWAYNAVDTADIIASAVCARADRAGLPARASAGGDPRAKRVREMLGKK